MMSSFQSPRSSARPAFSSSFAPSSDTPGGEGVLANRCGAFHVRTPLYNLRPCYSSNRPSPRLLAPCPSITGASPSIGSDYGSSRAYLLDCQSAPSVSPPFAPLNRHGERGERRGGLFSCLVRSLGLPVSSIIWDRGTEAIAFIVWLF